MAILQFGGLNGYTYYLSSILESAGKLELKKKTCFTIIIELMGELHGRFP